jgi:hypothetical protein
MAAACLAALAAPALAQVPAAPAPARDPQVGQRYQLAVMEGVLEAAVQLGARIVSQQWRAVSPEMLFVSGSARARGIRLENYGVFFDVAVPSMRQSVAWSWRVLDPGNAATVQTLKGLMKTVTDPAQKKDLDLIIRRLELQLGPSAPDAVGPTVVAEQPVGNTAVVAVPGGGRGGGRRTAGAVAGFPDDPGAAYTSEVKNALIDAMLDHSHALILTADEWLTVAAHDDADRNLAGADPYESVTMLFRVKGADLLALRAGRLTRDEARQRVEVKEY